MDQDRQIRFAIPPFFFFASLLLGIFLTGNPYHEWFIHTDGPHLLAVAAAVTAGTLPVGFAISATTFLLLRLSFLPTGREFETNLPPDALKAVWSALKTTLPAEPRFAFHAAVILDHELLSSGMHAWIMRRWNAFLISAQACVALALAHGVAWILQLEQPSRWILGSFCIGVILAVNAVTAWRGTMDMLAFQAHRFQSRVASMDATANSTVEKDAPQAARLSP